MPYGGDWEYDWGTGWDDRGSENGQIRFLTMLKTREDKNASRNQAGRKGNKFAALEVTDAEDGTEDVEDLEGTEFPELSEVVKRRAMKTWA